MTTEAIEAEYATTRELENEQRLLDGKSPLPIEFPLTEQQLQWIKPHLHWAGLQHAISRPGMVLALVAQVGHPIGKIKIGAQFIPAEVAQQLMERSPTRL